MDSQDQKDLRSIFDSFDIDKNGTIEIGEIKKIAQKLEESLTQEQLNQTIKLLDINGDNKISFEQFKFWWQKGKKGKMMRLVQLKAKSMKLTMFVKNKFKEANISMEGEKNVKPDVFDFKVSFGELKPQVQITYDLFVKGDLEKELRKKVLNLKESINESTIGLVMKIPSQNSAYAKSCFDEIVNEIISMPNFPLPIQNLQDNQFFSFSSDVMNQCLIVSFFLHGEIIKAGEETINSTQQLINKLGQQFSSKTNLKISLNSSIDQILETPIHQNLLKGFNFSFRTEANNSTFQRLRKLSEKQQKQMPLFNLFTLLRNLKLSWKLKSPAQIDKFLQKLGISENIGDLPLLSDLLEGFGNTIRENEYEDNPLRDLIRKIGRFAMKNADNDAQIFILKGKLGTSCLKINAKNISKIHSIVFNEY